MVSEEESEYAELLTDEPEPWDEWESTMVIWSVGLAIAAIAILGWLVNSYILQ